MCYSFLTVGHIAKSTVQVLEWNTSWIISLPYMFHVILQGHILWEQLKNFKCHTGSLIISRGRCCLSKQKKGLVTCSLPSGVGVAVAIMSPVFLMGKETSRLHLCLKEWAACPFSFLCILLRVQKQPAKWLWHSGKVQICSMMLRVLKNLKK